MPKIYLKIKSRASDKEIKYEEDDSHSIEETKEFDQQRKSKADSTEAIDEDIIIEELTEETLKTMVYGFKVNKDNPKEYMKKNYLKKITRKVCQYFLNYYFLFNFEETKQ